MKSRNWVRFFLTTLAVGGIAAGILGFVIRWDQYEPLFRDFKVMEIVMTFFWQFGVGLIFSVISQMGYFAYLTIHRFGLGFFRSLWNPVQILVIAFTLFDVVYFRYKAFAKGEETLLSYLVFPILIAIVGLITAYIKMKSTNRGAFIPALFFMVVVSIIEWVPAIQANEQGWLWFMLLPLLLCNVYQLLVLPRFLQQTHTNKLSA